MKAPIEARKFLRSFLVLGLVFACSESEIEDNKPMGPEYITLPSTQSSTDAQADDLFDSTHGTVVMDRGAESTTQSNGPISHTTVVTTGSSSSAGGQQGKTYRLAIVDVGKRFLTPLQLASTAAQHFNLGALWQAPRDCVERIDHPTVCAAEDPSCRCPNQAELQFCGQAMQNLDELYCRAGGESRQAASYLGTNFTSGDLIVLWQTALNICSLEDSGQNIAARHIGVGYNQQKSRIAGELVTKFLGLPENTETWQLEVDYLMASILMPESSPGESAFRESNPSELHEKFSAACAYLVTHSSQVVY